MRFLLRIYRRLPVIELKRVSLTHVSIIITCAKYVNEFLIFQLDGNDSRIFKFRCRKPNESRSKKSVASRCYQIYRWRLYLRGNSIFPNRIESSCFCNNSRPRFPTFRAIFRTEGREDALNLNCATSLFPSQPRAFSRLTRRWIGSKRFCRRELGKRVA